MSTEEIVKDIVYELNMNDMSVGIRPIYDFDEETISTNFGEISGLEVLQWDKEYCLFYLNGEVGVIYLKKDRDMLGLPSWVYQKYYLKGKEELVRQISLLVEKANEAGQIDATDLFNLLRPYASEVVVQTLHDTYLLRFKDEVSIELTYMATGNKYIIRIN